MINPVLRIEGNLLDFISRIIRLTLSLQSLSRKSLSSTCIDTLRKFQTFYHFNTNNELKFDTETESNIALLMVNETKLQHKNDNIEVIVDYVEENLQLFSSVNNERSTSFVIHNISALAISSELTDLFQSSRERDSDPSCTRFEILYDMLERWAVCEIDSHLSVAHASATYNLVNGLQKFLKLKVEKTVSNHIANIHQIFPKIESYVLGILCHKTDKIKYIARNILNVLVAIYREYLPTEQHLHQLILKCMDMPWEQKIKYLALLSIFKHSSNQSSASVKAAKDVELLYPDMPSILANQLLSVHPSLESHCADLYEVLVYNDYVKNVAQINNDDHPNEVKYNDEGQNVRTWFDKWYMPMLNLVTSDLGNISVPSLEKLINTGMKLNDKTLYYLIEHYQTYHQNNDKDCREKSLQLIMIALKKQKLSDKTDLFKVPKSAMTDIITNCCFHFNEEIRIKALELLVCSKSSKELFKRDELDLILNAIPTNMVLDLRSTRQDFIHCIRRMFDRMKEGLNASRKSENCTSSASDLNEYYDDFLSKAGKYFLSCFFEGATSNRRSIALEAIHIIIVTFIVTFISPAEQVDMINVPNFELI